MGHFYFVHGNLTPTVPLADLDFSQEAFLMIKYGFHQELHRIEHTHA